MSSHAGRLRQVGTAHLCRPGMMGALYASRASAINTPKASTSRMGCQLKSWPVSLPPFPSATGPKATPPKICDQASAHEAHTALHAAVAALPSTHLHPVAHHDQQQQHRQPGCPCQPRGDRRAGALPGSALTTCHCWPALHSAWVSHAASLKLRLNLHAWLPCADSAGSRWTAQCCW
jgi:hypothetical protein